MKYSEPKAVVIGAGIVGLCAAYYLRRSGLHVVIIDRNDPGTGCSAGNAGSISPGSVAPLGLPGIAWQAPRMLLDPNGPLSIPLGSLFATAPWLARLMAASRPSAVAAISDALHELLKPAIVRYQEMMSDIGSPELLQVTGQLHLYPNKAAMAKDAGGWRLRREHGVRLEAVGPDEIRSLEPDVGRHYKLGYFMPDQGMVTNPLRQAQALAEWLARQGVTFVRDDVTGFLVEDRRIVGVAGAGGRYEADHVVLCAGAWSGRLLETLGIQVPLDTQRGYHVTLPAGSIRLKRPVVAADRKVFATPMEVGLRLAGTVEFGGLDRAPNYRRARLLLKHGKRLFPELDTEAEYSEWMGHRPCMPDSLPVIGGGSGFSGLWFNFGHGHLGLTMAAVSGELLSRTVRSNEPQPDLTPFSIDRFGGRPVDPAADAKPVSGDTLPDRQRA